MRKYTNDEEMMTCGKHYDDTILWKLWQAFHNFDEHPSKDTAIELGAGELIVAVMRSFRHHEDLQSHGCVVLRSLSYNFNTTRIRKLVEIGAHEDVIKATENIAVSNDDNLDRWSMSFLADCLDCGEAEINRKVKNTTGIRQAALSRQNPSDVDAANESARLLRLLK